MTAHEGMALPLESGDRMSRAEFHRRYCARPEIRKAELVGGVVYVASPVRVRMHGAPFSLVHFWLNSYAMHHPEIEIAADSTVFLDEDDEVQPDACVYRRTFGGEGARVTDAGYLEGAPELVVEVAASSASYDLHDKKEAYRRAGVPEYVVWRVIDGDVDWFVLRDGVYVRLEPGADGVIESARLPGLRLAVAALLAGDRAALVAALPA